MLINMNLMGTMLRRLKSISGIRKYSSIGSNLVNSFPVGSEHHGFIVQEVTDIPDLDMAAVKLSHKKCGAEYFHFAKDDANNVFSVGFRTPAINDYGTTHILEHNVLCGSQKFPCKDPFFKMLNRSLSTFMNAMTGPDYTFYPFATQNSQDFINLLSVYLDAVFHPNLSETDFLQEGWRLEQEHPGNDKSPIIFKGVVFNEMKGVFADAQQIFAREIFSALLPSHAYGHESGGIPLEIPNLTWEQLKHYHRTYYHPSNSYMISYGNQPLEDHLGYINDNYLNKFKAAKAMSIVPAEERWKSPQELKVACNFDPVMDADKQNSVAVSYMLSDINDSYNNFVLNILSDLLISGSNSPFYKTLLESKLGSSYCQASGLDTHTRNTTFTIGLQGVKSSDMDKVKETIENTFKEVYNEGFNEQRIESVLHNIELELKHQTSSFGLNVAMSLTPIINNNVNPLRLLQITDKIAKFRENLKEDKDYLKNFVKSFFMDNTHKLISTMSPDNSLQEKLIKKEEEILQSRVLKLNESDISKIKESGLKMQANLEKNEDTSCLPTLQISDIQRSISEEHFDKLEHNGIPLYLHQLPTNGVAYFSAVLGIDNVPERLKHIVPLFCSLITSMGAGKYDFKQLGEAAKLVSSGLSSSLHIARDPYNINEYEHGIIISSYSLIQNFSKMMDLWETVLNELRLNDQERLNTLLNMITTDMSNSIVHNGHSYAMSAADSYTNSISKLKEEASGLTALSKLLQINEMADKENMLSDLRELSNILLNKSKLRLSLNVSSNYSKDCYNRLTKVLDNMDGSFTTERLLHCSENIACSSNNTHEVFPFPVNYVAKSIKCVSYSHPNSGPLRVLARLMFKFLHREIREKGGAYGGGAVYSPGETFKFYSYRDPRSLETLSSFNEAVDWVLNKEFTEQDLNEAKLGVFQKLDAPVSTGSKGLRYFLFNLSHDTYCTHRLSVLNTSYDSVIGVANKYLKGNPEGICIIGPKNDKIKNNKSWKTVEH